MNNNRAEQIAGRLRLQAAAMAVGEKLPSVRALSKSHGASPVTITAAIAELEAAGIVRAEPGRGTFVARSDEPKRATLSEEPDFAWQSSTLGRTRVDPGRVGRFAAAGTAGQVQLSWGYLAPELQPFDELRTIGSRCAKSHRAWTMAPPMGLPDLRAEFATELGAEMNEVLVMPGGQQSLAFAMRTLADPGSTLITESPGYPGATIAAQAAGLNIAAVQSDQHGIIPERLAEALERTRAKLIYLQPGCSNPSGSVLAPDRRQEVLALAKRHGAFIIEDDWARNLTLDGVAAPQLFTQDADGHVVTISTLSKPAAPGLRVGAIAARGPAGERLRTARIADDMCVPPLTQEIALALLSSAAWPRHLTRLRTGLLARRDAMVTAIRSELPGCRLATVPSAGIHLWLKLPEGRDSTALTVAAATSGVMIGDGRLYFVDEPPAPFIRLSFSAASSGQITEGVLRVAQLLHGELSAVN